uniref:PAMP-induced secreted peptide n=1 Tax=Vitis vinifera TaxID=29760 RepID=A0AB39A383_VITVI
MARALKFVSFLFLVLVLNSIAIHGRPFNVLKKPRGLDGEEMRGFFDGLSLGAIKQSGPSPGNGHKFTNAGTLGGIKDSGPSPGNGHKFTNAGTLGGIKDSGPSPGEGHKYVDGMPH